MASTVKQKKSNKSKKLKNNILPHQKKESYKILANIGLKILKM